MTLEPIKGKRREMTVVLTESGKRYADDILKEIYQKENEVFKKLDTADLQLVEQLEKIALLLRK